MQAIHATYENGVFRPAQPVELSEGAQVTLWLAPENREIAHLRPEDREFLDELASRRREVFRRLAE
jgi:predicted DNA-binding antitoxin AbrB/MazE fold protein